MDGTFQGQSIVFAIAWTAQSGEAEIRRGGRETAEGRIGAYVAPDMKSAGIIEMRCESPSVVKADAFVQLTNDLARQIAAKEPAGVEALLAEPLAGQSGRTVNDRIHDVIGAAAPVRAVIELNAVTIAQELAILAPFLAAAWLVRVKTLARLTTEVPCRDQAAQ